MGKDKRYLTVHRLIAGGYLTEFREIFETLPKSVLAKDMGTNNTRITRLIEHPKGFDLGEIVLIAALLDVPPMTVVALVLQQGIRPGRPPGSQSL